MSVRLNKALSDFNIGLQTAVDFLKKKYNLSEDLESTSKITEDQYHALEVAFKKDAETRSKADQLISNKKKDKRRPKPQRPQAAPTTEIPRVKVVGHIDLSQLEAKPSQSSAQSKAAAAVGNAKPAQPQSKPQAAQTPAQPKPQQAPVEQPKPQPKAQSKPQPQAAQPASQTAQQPAPETKAETAQQPSVFKTKIEQDLQNAPKLKVMGKIDLSALNQSTRPKKKSKDERRKEREEKNQQHTGDRKKRKRINSDRVDINAVVDQMDKQGGNKNKNKGNNNQGNNNQGGGKKKNKRPQKPLEVNEEDVSRQVKETLARLTNKQNFNKKGAKYRREKREAVQERMNEQASEANKQSKTLKLTEFVTVSELATMMNVSVNKVIGTLMGVGIMVSINQRLDAETINLVAEEFGFKTEYVSAEVQEAVSEEPDDEADLVSRPPIVTVMGHVDHGKTSLLDHIRNTNVIAGEAGGITQHIGAYSVTLKNGRKVTFLDTPGHEAFTAMRARGAQVTDIAIIIIAADDSVMPTTKEAIAHAQAAGVPMVFAINKIDKPGANPDKIREDLANMNLLVEDWGGKYQCQEISAKKGIGVDELMEKVLLEADMLDLKANPNRKGTGGTSWGRIKAMFNERNQRIDNAGPSTPAIILGLNGAPTAGDTFHVLDTEQEAREIATKREQLQREQGLRTQQRLTLGDISRRIAKGEFHELNIIVKGDVDGSVEALSDSFIKLSTDKVKVNVIYKAVGQISESDVTLADASDALIISTMPSTM